MPNEHFLYTVNLLDLVQNSNLVLSEKQIDLIDKAVKEIYHDAWLVGFREATQLVETRFAKKNL